MQSPQRQQEQQQQHREYSRTSSCVRWHGEDDTSIDAPGSGLPQPLASSTSSSLTHPPRTYHHNQPHPHVGEIELSPPADLPIDPSSIPQEIQFPLKADTLTTKAPSTPIIASLAIAPTSLVRKTSDTSAPATITGVPKSDATTVTAAYKEAMAIANIENGLSTEIVESQRTKYGWNETIEPETPLWLLFLRKFQGAVPYMIIIAMVVAFGLQKWVDGSVIAILLLINGCISFHEDLRARKAMRELIQSLQVVARTKRNGEWHESLARELVPSDLIRLRTGDIAGADVCVLNGHLSVDQSALTGESDLKNISRGGLLFAGSIIKRGEANALVVAIGSNTYFGKTAQLVQASVPNPHIQSLLTRVVGVLMSIIIVLVVVTLIVIGSKGDSIVDAIPLLLMVIITALPVALPAMFTVSMALGSQELSKRGVLVTRLNVIEDCALMSILFSDKTGTLSQNLMSVQSIVPLLPGATSQDVLLAAALCSRHENADPIDRAVLNALDERKRAKAAGDSSFEQQPDPSTFIAGEAPLAINTLLPSLDSKDYRLLKFIPFDASSRRTEAILQPSSKRNAENVQTVRVTKGAVATLALAAGIALDSPQYAKINALVEANANRGQKSLAVGVGVLDQEEAEADHEADERQALLATTADPHLHSAPASVSSRPQFRLVGLISLHDPPRADSAAVIAKLESLGIATKMLTGDSIGVAKEMGRNLKLGEEFVNLEHEKQLLRDTWKREADERAANNRNQAGQPRLHAATPAGNVHPEEVRLTIDGADMTEAETPGQQEERLMSLLLARFDPMTVTGFAQIFPADKHAIVKFAQTKNLICGMTGDGVNDAPALKQAEVGCAVANATDVAKGSSSALLLNEGLSGVPHMVEVGRQVHSRVVVWVINKVAKAAMHSSFILILFLILGRFPVTALEVVLMLLLMDFVLLSIATDRQPAGHKPAQWNLAQLTRIGLTIGLPGMGQILGVILIAEHYFDQTVDESQTTAWLAMFEWGYFDFFVRVHPSRFHDLTCDRVTFAQFKFIIQALPYIQLHQLHYITTSYLLIMASDDPSFASQVSNVVESRSLAAFPQYTFYADSRIWSSARNQYLKQSDHSSGYRAVSVSGNKVSVHVPICRAFHGEAPSQSHTNRIIMHPIFVGRHHQSRPAIVQRVPRRRRRRVVQMHQLTHAVIKVHDTLRGAAKAVDAPSATIAQVVYHTNRHTGNSHGYYWEFEEDHQPVVTLDVEVWHDLNTATGMQSACMQRQW